MQYKQTNYELPFSQTVLIQSLY